MRIYSKTDTGLVRKENQDAYFAETLSDNAVFVVVCDGMGGAAGGNVASKKAVEIIKRFVQKAYKDSFGEKELIHLLQNAVLSANIELFRLSKSNAELNGMGTTVVACIVTPERAVICHVGDSRAYVIGETVTQITRDHSVVQSLIESGKLTAEQARSHPKKNIITRALGVEENVISDIDCVDIGPGDFLLICTDGLTNYVEPGFIENAFKQFDQSKDIAALLCSEANRNGGRDNITAVVVANTPKGE